MLRRTLRGGGTCFGTHLVQLQHAALQLPVRQIETVCTSVVRAFGPRSRANSAG